MFDVLARLREVAARTPANIALTSRAGYLDYASLVGNIEAAIRHGASQGLRAGQLVVIKTEHQDARLQLIVAMMGLGCRVGVSMDLDSYRSHELAVDAVITDDPKAKSAKRVLRLDSAWFKASPLAARPLPQAGPYSLLFNSSGSTGTRKLIEISDIGFAYRIGTRLNDVHLGDRPRFLGIGGDGTSNMVQDKIAVLLKGGLVIHAIDPSPVGALDAIQVYQPTYAVASPSALVEMLKSLEARPAAFQKVGVIRVGGAHCSRETRSRALQLLADRFLTSFGATETGNIASVLYERADEIDLSAGTVRDEIEIAIADAQGQILPPGSEGMLRIRVPAGVLATYPGSAQVAPRTVEEGWFLPGDIARLDEDRRLFILGRSTQVINFGGNNIDPELLETAVVQNADILDAGIVGIDGPHGFAEIHAVVVSVRPIDAFKLNAYLKTHGFRVTVRHVQAVDAIPRTETGKVDRVALRRLIEANQAG